MDCVSPSSALSFPLLPFCLPLYTICWLALASSSSSALAWRWPDTPSPSAEAPPIFARFSCFPSAHKARASLIVPPYVSHSHAFAKRSPKHICARRMHFHADRTWLSPSIITLPAVLASTSQNQPRCPQEDSRCAARASSIGSMGQGHEGHEGHE